LLVAPSQGGKLTPDAIRALAMSRSGIHFPKSRVVTIPQPAETGRVYSVEEIRAISQVGRALGLKLHMGGARVDHACAALGCAPAEITWKAGVDVLCFGGMKNGMAVGEAILFFDSALAEDFD
jgi:threonine aldolase